MNWVPIQQGPVEVGVEETLELTSADARARPLGAAKKAVRLGRFSRQVGASHTGRRT